MRYDCSDKCIKGPVTLASAGWNSKCRAQTNHYILHTAPFYSDHSVRCNMHTFIMLETNYLILAQGCTDSALMTKDYNEPLTKYERKCSSF